MNLIDLSNINDVQKNLDQTSANTFTFASNFDWDSPSEDVIIKFGTNSQSSSNVPALKFGIDGSLQAKNLDGDYQYLGAITGSNHPQNTDLGTNATTFTLNNTNDNNVSTTTLLFGKLPEDTSDPAGVRNLNGVMQYKNSGAEWADMGSGGEGTSNPTGTSSTRFTVANATASNGATVKELYFGTGTGSSAVGFKVASGGILQYKNYGDSAWTNFGSSTEEYILVPATTEDLGGVIVGNGFEVDLTGILDLKVASAAQLGGVKIKSGGNITITEDGEIDATSSSSGLTWSTISTSSTNASVNNGYICDASEQVNVTLPSTFAVGDMVEIVGKGSGSWKATAQSGDVIRMGTTISNSGGYISADEQYNSVVLKCSVANTEWRVVGAQGNFTISTDVVTVPRIYFFGGQAIQNTIDKLSNDTTCSATSATLSVSRYDSAAEALSSSIYIAGGYTTVSQNVIDKLTGDSACSAVAATLSVSKKGHASGVISSSAYFAGGYTTVITNGIDKLTGDSSCSAVSATLASVTNHARGATLSSSLYFAGGSPSGGTESNTINKLTNDTTCSSVSATLSASKDSVASAVISSSAYFAGGMATSGSITTIDKLTGDSSCAAVSATLSASKYGASGATMSSAAYFGGGTISASYTNVICKLTGDSSCSAVSATLSGIRTYASAESISI